MCRYMYIAAIIPLVLFFTACLDDTSDFTPYVGLQSPPADSIPPTSNPMGGAEEDKYDYTFTYLALGDSYTIGEAVETNERWPVQLSQLARSNGYELSPPAILARTGWTTADLRNAINNTDYTSADTTYTFVSLLIGVNDQFRGYNVSVYPDAFRELLEMAIRLADGRTENVFVVSIPDYGVTPFANGAGEAIGAKIDAYNDVNRFISEEMEVAYFYITDISREAETDLSLLAGDRLHPSGKMYARWASLIQPWLLQRLDSLAQ